MTRRQMPMSERLMVRCAVCREVFKGFVPKGGDGSALIPYRHKRKNPDVLVWCDGRFVVGRRVSPP